MTACDVLVAGGGGAGLAAAVASARAGAETLLVERGGMLGGMATAAFVHTICGLYAIREEAGAVFANEGFAPEFARRLLREGAARPPLRMGRLDVLPHDPTLLAAVADELAGETPRLRVWFHAELCAAQGTPGRLEEIGLHCRGRHLRVRAAAWVDATGDASLTALAGGAFAQAPPERLQRPAYVAQLSGLTPALLEPEGRLRLAHAIVQGIKRGQLPGAAMGAGFRPAFAPGEAFLTLDLAGEAAAGPWDPVSPEHLAGVEITGRRTVLTLARHLAAEVPGADACRVAAWPARAGVRESRRACGVYEISGDEIRTGASQPDAVAVASWPMELREQATGPRWQYPEPGCAAGIPLRALRHRELENLWLAGRCLSATHEAQASLRVIGSCLATGEAAGLAAADALQPRDGGWASAARRVITTRENLPRSC